MATDDQTDETDDLCADYKRNIDGKSPLVEESIRFIRSNPLLNPLLTNSPQRD